MRWLNLSPVINKTKLRFLGLSLTVTPHCRSLSPSNSLSFYFYHNWCKKKSLLGQKSKVKHLQHASSAGSTHTILFTVLGVVPRASCVPANAVPPRWSPTPTIQSFKIFFPLSRNEPLERRFKAMSGPYKSYTFFQLKLRSSVKWDGEATDLDFLLLTGHPANTQHFSISHP